MTLWGERNLAFLRRLRPYAHGIPSHDTLGEVIRAVDPDLFKGCFASWMEGLHTSQPDILTPESLLSMEKRRGARMPATRAASRCIRCPPGPAGSGFDLPPGKWTPGYAVFRSACSG